MKGVTLYRCLCCNVKAKTKKELIVHLKTEAHEKEVRKLHQDKFHGQAVLVMGCHIGRRIMRVTMLVRNHSAATLLCAAVTGANDKYAKTLKVAMQFANVRIKTIAELMDKLNEDERKDAAAEEGNEGSAVVRKAYWRRRTRS